MSKLGHHELLERLGQGAMGVVWKARDLRSGRLVALKVLRESGGGRRFRREFRAAQRLDHSNIVPVFDMGHDALDGVWTSWFTMEFVTGSTLRDLIDRENAGWPPERNSSAWLASRLSLIHQMALGLEHCHAQGVLHRDLKPTNVLVDDEGVVKLVDFGLARLDGQASSLSGGGQLIGTVAYMSPEQARGGQLDVRSDLHGFGAVLHELLCGEPAFRAEDLPSLLMQVLFEPAPEARAANQGLEPRLADLSARCLAKDPRNRPQSAREVAHEVLALANELGLSLEDGAPSLPGTQVRALLPQIVGRESESKALLDAVERARDRPLSVLLSGTSGVGKSRLSAELRMEAELLGFRVLASASSPSARPLASLRAALAVALKTPPQSSSHDVQLLSTVLPELFSQDLAEDETSSETAAPTDRIRVAWAAEALLSHLLDQGSHLLLFDDMQWVDALSAQVIEGMLKRTEGSLLLIGVFREEDAEVARGAVRLRSAFSAKADCLQLELKPLDVPGVAAVVESMLGVAPPPEVAAELARATGGIPHDIEQVVRELAARGSFTIDDDALHVSLPPNLELAMLSASEATRSQLAKLGPEARRIVLAVLVTGGRAHVGTLTEALELDEDTLLDELEVLVHEGLLRDGPGVDVVSLGHDRLREALSADGSADELRSLRVRLARVLEGGGGRSEIHRVAELDLAAGSLEQACRTVPVSAEALAATGLHAAALERYESLIELASATDSAPPVDVMRRRAELLVQAGRTEDSVTAYRDLLADESAHAIVPPYVSLRQMSFSLMLLTRNDEAVETLERSLRLAGEANDWSGCVRASSVLGTVLDNLGQLDRAWTMHEKAVHLARERGDSMDLAMALTNIGVSAYQRRRLTKASAYYHEAAPLFDQAGKDLYAANCRSGHAAVLLAHGEPESCRPIAREALRSMRRAVDVRGLSRVLEVLGLASLELGDVAEARACLGEAFAIRRRLDEPWAIAETLLNQASLAVHCCRWSEAETLLDQAKTLFGEAGDEERLAVVGARRAELTWRAGHDGARELVEQALAGLKGHDGHVANLEMRLCLARIQSDEGQAALACEHLREAIEVARGLDSEAPLQFLETELLTARTLSGEIEGLARAAKAVLAAAPRRPIAARVMDQLAAVGALRSAGEPEAAAAALGEAELLLERLLNVLPPDEREAFREQHALKRLFALARDPLQEDEMSATERTELQQLRSFHSLVMSSEPSEPHSLLSAFVRMSLEQLSFARGFVFLVEQEELSCAVGLDAKGRDIPLLDRRVPDQLLRHALAKGKPVLSIRIEDDPEFDHDGSVVDLNVEAFAAVPVASEDGMLAVAYFDGPTPSRDLQDELGRLSPLFKDLGSLLNRARRVQERTKRAETLLTSFTGGSGPITGNSVAIEELRRLVQIVAPTEASVLILGESGSGKELVARELHARSERSNGRLLSRSCAELAESLLESELFGHVKGAFTGASSDRPGLFEQASLGTLFLDEVAEMPASLQAKLLRVLETGEVTRVGSTTSRHVDVRVLAATHRDLAAAVKNGSFRQDLYYRLKVIELRVPPLRDHLEDLPLLAHHFLALFTASRESRPRGFTHDAMRALLAHDWPGNVRELRNVIERAVILSGQREEVTRDLLPPELLREPAGVEKAGAAPVTGKDLRSAKDAFERACILAALAESDQNRTHAARALGISVRGLQQKLNRHGLK